MGYGNQERHSGDFDQSSHSELGHPVKTYLGVRPFSRRAPSSVYGFGFLGCHSLPPPDDLRTIAVAGLKALLFRPVPRESHRRVDAHSSLLQSCDVVPGSKAAVHQVGLRVLTRTLDYLLFHRCCLARVRTLRGDCDTHDDPISAVGGQLHIVSWPEAAIGHLHDPGLGVCSGDPRRRHSRALGDRPSLLLAFLRRLRLGQVAQRLPHPVLSLLCGALPRPLFALRNPRVRMLTLLCQSVYLGSRPLKAFLQRLLPTKGCGASARSYPHPILGHSLRIHYVGSH